LGVPYFDESGKLLKVVEKPENPPNEFGVPGLYMFGPNVFRAFDRE
jgi:dTDP-glucose pyrophosphorylase